MDQVYLVLEGDSVRGYYHFKTLLSLEKIKDSVKESQVPFMIGNKKVIKITINSKLTIF